MNTIQIPKEYNYVGVFLTTQCSLKCSYCINIQDYGRGQLHREYKPMRSQDWILALNRISLPPTIPLTLQGGEPTQHRYFYKIVNSVENHMDLLTNLQFNVHEFMRKVPVNLFRRDAPYASIRVSYHPEQMNLMQTVQKTITLHKAGYEVQVHMIEIAGKEHEYAAAKRIFEFNDIVFKGKELLDKEHGTYKYKGAVNGELKSCLCKTSELLIAPDGGVFRCHSDLYNIRANIGNILDPEFKIHKDFSACSAYGSCSGCDIKITTDRFQKYGHTSVEIKNVV